MDTNLDIAAFNRLFGDYQHRFIRFALTYVSNETVAEDLVMESFTAAWEHRDHLSVAEFPPYTLTIVKNKCLNHLRAQGVRQRASENIRSHGQRMFDMRIATLEACNPEELFSDEARELVDKALAALPQRTREIFVRSRFQGESYKQIAEELGTTVKSVEFEIAKAMKILRVTLKDYLPILAFWFYIN